MGVVFLDCLLEVCEGGAGEAEGISVVERDQCAFGIGVQHHEGDVVEIEGEVFGDDFHAVARWIWILVESARRARLSRMGTAPRSNLMVVGYSRPSPLERRTRLRRAETWGWKGGFSVVIGMDGVFTGCRRWDLRLSAWPTGIPRAPGIAISRRD